MKELRKEDCQRRERGWCGLQEELVVSVPPASTVKELRKGDETV